MKKKFYLVLICLLGAFTFQTQAANVVPTPGAFYNIIQTPSGMHMGTVGSQPVVQTAASTLDQAFEFIPVDGLTDTYYIRNYSGLYFEKSTSNAWSTIFSATKSTTIGECQWVIVDDASSTTAFRIMLVSNSKYLATDGITTNSYLYCDKTNTNERGIFTLVATAVPSDINNAYKSLTLGNTSAVTSNMTLPTTVGTTGVTVTWASSNKAVVDTLGNVTRPAQYNSIVKLTATLSQTVSGTVYSLTKIFTVKVLGVIPTPDEIASWTFAPENIAVTDKGVTVTDTKSGFTGTLMNDASICTIGKTTKYNVLDLGNGTGYFDMGTEIGKSIYSLDDYTMCCYFRCDSDYTAISNAGNFVWTFSNTADAATDMNGYVIGHLNSQVQECTPKYWNSGNQGVSVGKAASIGSWHHFCYTQKADTGTIFIDGVVAKTGIMTNLPGIAIPIAGRTGTLYNWLGRSNYTSDSYLKKTLLYDFRLMGVAITADDMNLGGIEGFEPVPATLESLNNAYLENKKVVPVELDAEKQNLSLGNLDAVTSNLTLPLKGTLDNTITISWKTTNPNLIASDGTVIPPAFYDYNDTLTATLSKNGTIVTKIFPAKVLAKSGSAFTNNLIYKLDFSNISDSTAIESGEKHFKATLKKNAKFRTIGNTVKYNVVSLGDSIGYIDLGQEIGQVMYHLNNFTLGAYFRIDSTYTGLKNNGNFIWNFSNSKDIINDPKGYLIASLRNQAATITPSNWTPEQTVAIADSAMKNGWHHFAYTQNGTTGTVYIDGMPLASQTTITSLPSNTLPKSGQLGTIYNWIGRSCYTGDVYLRKSLVYDFRLYQTALTDEQIQNSVLNVGSTINALNAAYVDTPSALKSILNSQYKVTASEGMIKIIGLTGTEKVSIFDISGRQLRIENPALISAKAGVYIVKVNNNASKVIVR